MVGTEFAEHAPEGPGESTRKGEGDAKVLHRFPGLGLEGDQQTAFHLAFEDRSDRPGEVV
jgi:hypothetical protein